MHLVLANQWFPPEGGRGGVAMWNDTTARAYRALGHRVTVVTSRTSVQTPVLKEIDGIRVQRLLVKDAHRWRRLPALGRYVREIQQVTYARRVDRALRDLYRAQPFDAVEFAEVNAEGFFYTRNPLTPVVVRCHTPTFVLRRYYDEQEMPYDTRIISWGEKDLIRRAHALTAPSHDMARIIATECGVPIESITVIPNALAVSEFHPTLESSKVPTSERSINILYVGRLERAKGVAVLVSAIPLVLRQISNARFVFIGEDRPTARGSGQRAVLEAQLTEAGVGGSVEFIGGVDRPTLLNWYGRADICVVPSLLYESFSYTCAQAMAAGKPVVASRVGGIPETVDDGRTGILVMPGNAEEFAEAIVLLARDPTRREEMGRAGREKAACEYDPIHIAKRNLHAYERARQKLEHPNV